MTTRVGLMGFGRIGRNVMRLLQDRDDLQVVAIQDTARHEGLVYLLKYDSIYGRFHGEVSAADEALIVDGRRISFGSATTPADTEWSKDGVDIVIDTTSRYQDLASLNAHLETGANKVVLTSSPETPGEIPLLIMGINDRLLESGPEVVALGSNTAIAAAPILESLHREFGVARAYITTVKAMSKSGRLADVPTDGFRTSRAAGENIIPSETNSAEVISQALPALRGVMLATSVNVPVPDGSVIDMLAEVPTGVTVEQVNRAVAEAVAARYSRIIEYTADPIVSTDVRNNPHSGVFDSLATMVTGETLVKTVTWFNNGWGYSHRVVEVASKMTGGTR